MEPKFPIRPLKANMAGFGPQSLEKYQAKLNPLKAPPLLKEARDAHRVTVVEFPSLELAKACYDDPAYVEARSFALRASNRELFIFEGEFA